MRAQASVFMVLAVLIVVFAVLLAVISKEARMVPQSPVQGLPAQALTPQIQQVRNIAQSCLDESLKQGLLLFGLQGGYIFPRVLVGSLDVDGFLVPFYVYDGKDIVPDWETVFQSQLGSYVETSVFECMSAFEDLPGLQGIASPHVRLSGSESLLRVEMSSPAEVMTNKGISKVPETYFSQVPSRLVKTMRVAAKIAKDPAAGKGFVDLSLLDDLTRENYNVTVFPVDDQRFFYVITDNQDSVYDLPFRFQFAVKVKEHA